MPEPQSPSRDRQARSPLPKLSLRCDAHGIRCGVRSHSPTSSPFTFCAVKQRILRGGARYRAAWPHGIKANLFTHRVSFPQRHFQTITGRRRRAEGLPCHSEDAAAIVPEARRRQAEAGRWREGVAASSASAGWAARSRRACSRAITISWSSIGTPEKAVGLGQIAFAVAERLFFFTMPAHLSELRKLHKTSLGARAGDDARSGLFFEPHEELRAYGDKVIGTNHTLPTRKAARYTGGLWVGSSSKRAPIRESTLTQRAR